MKAEKEHKRHTLNQSIDTSKENSSQPI